MSVCVPRCIAMDTFRACICKKNFNTVQGVFPTCRCTSLHAPHPCSSAARLCAIQCGTAFMSRVSSFAAHLRLPADSCIEVLLDVSTDAMLSDAAVIACTISA